MTIGEQIAAEAELWVGTPFVWQGRIKQVGCDCKGLIAGVARVVGRAEGESLEALAGDYGENVPVAALKAGLARLFDQVPAADRCCGDVLLIATGGKAQHLAICAPSARAPLRVIEALHRGPMQVRPFRRAPAEIDSAWRWRDLETAHG